MSVPQVYVGWLAEVLGGPIPGERRATCDRCPLCETGERFRLDVKCCGYLPSIPNYLVGHALRQGGDSATSMRRRLADRVAVSPLGVGTPPTYSARWQEVDRTTGFGSEPDLVCPHFDAGSCAIWASREAVCTTWFCRLERGAVGQIFWLELRAFLAALERTLSRWALAELDLDPMRRPVGWGPFTEDREALFLRCLERVEALTWSEVRALGGFEIRTRRRDLRAAHAERIRPAPLRFPLEQGEFTAGPGPLGVRLRAWSEYDALDLPASVVDALDCPETLGTETLRALVDHGILKEPLA